MAPPGKLTMSFLRILLLPFSWLYASALKLRHWAYDRGILTSQHAGVPTIAIGNLALGGTGKTPMMELVLRTLEGNAPLATLSRGYGRTGTDIHEVLENDTAERSGDEPLQVKRKFPTVHVFVGADRVKAVGVIQQQVPDVKAVVLDDALQHRRLRAGLNILLTTWQRPYCDDMLLPVGRLRDLPSRSKAAQVVVVTKCPALPDAAERDRWRHRLGLRDEQALFFSGIAYEQPRSSVDGGRSKSPSESERTDRTSSINCLLFTGIADPGPLVAHVASIADQMEHIAFSDHHRFTKADLQRLAGRYAKFAPGPKMLATTEKDAARLGSVIAGSALEGLPLATIGMRAIILNEPERFEDLIRRHVATHPAHR
jgi:tetraacyldisaccharide 4'-kinase